MRQRFYQALFLSSIVLCLCLTGYFFVFHLDVAREHHPWHVPAALNGSLGFGKVLYVSLPSRTDRRDALSLSFYLSGMEPAEYVTGVRGEDISEAAKPKSSTDLLPGVIGCWRGHANAWKRVIDAGWETALVIEDDTDWHIDIKTQMHLLSGAVKEWRKDIHDVTIDHPYGSQWDILVVGHCLEAAFNRSEESYLIYPDPTVMTPDKQTPTNRQVLTDFDVPAGHRVVSNAKFPICTMGYAVTREGAARLLYNFGVDHLDAPIDIEIGCACSSGLLRCLEVNPALVGVYRAEGTGLKNSDIAVVSPDSVEVMPTENFMGEHSVRAMAGKVFAS